MYHYIECGLDYVFLLNGFREEKSVYGDTIFIDNADELHKCIGISIAKSPADLSPAEVRFLRVEMELSQKDLGSWMDVDSQTIARWEKGESAIPGPADRLLKALYLDFIEEGSNVREMCERLAELDQYEPLTEVHFEDFNGEWRIAA